MHICGKIENKTQLFELKNDLRNYAKNKSTLTQLNFSVFPFVECLNWLVCLKTYTWKVNQNSVGSLNFESKLIPCFYFHMVRGFLRGSKKNIKNILFFLICPLKRYSEVNWHFFFAEIELLASPENTWTLIFSYISKKSRIQFCHSAFSCESSWKENFFYWRILWELRYWDVRYMDRTWRRFHFRNMFTMWTQARDRKVLLLRVNLNHSSDFIQTTHENESQIFHSEMSVSLYIILLIFEFHLSAVSYQFYQHRVFITLTWNNVFHLQNTSHWTRETTLWTFIWPVYYVSVPSEMILDFWQVSRR